MQRHRGLYRDMDGAVEWNRWFQTFCRCHSDAPRWTNQMWIDHLHRGSNKKRFQCCLNSDIFTLSTRAIQGHSGGNNVELLLLVDVQTPCTWNKYIYHVGSSLDLLSTIQSGWIAGGKDTKEGRQAVFFPAVSSMTEPQKR